jgi:hypothetical protein
MRVDQLTEEEMVGIAQNVDNVLFSMTEITELPPLSVASIVLARLMWLTKETGSEDDFKNLLRKVADGDVATPSTQKFIH